MKLRDLGERKIIENCITQLLNKYNYEYNDVSYIHIGEKIIATNVEGYVIEKWKLPFTTWVDCGWRACAGACSDLIAKFSKPTGAGISLDLSSDLEITVPMDIIRGFLEFLDKYNIKLLKMDTNESNCTSLTVYVIGIADREIPLRVSKECKVYTKPIFGYTGIIFKLYSRKMLHEFEKDKIVRKGINIIKRPELDFKLLEIDHHNVIASTDSSDGLGASLWTVAEISRMRIEIEQLPTSIELLEFCKQNNISPIEVIFNGGEEYVPIIFTDDKDLEKSLEDLGYMYVGRVVKGESSVTYRGSIVIYRGWEYFKSCYT